MIPNKDKHNPDPDYLRSLIAKIGLSQSKIAQELGINSSQFRTYFVHHEKNSHRSCPYLTQYALESWVIALED